MEILRAWPQDAQLKKTMGCVRDGATPYGGGQS